MSRHHEVSGGRFDLPVTAGAAIPPMAPVNFWRLPVTGVGTTALEVVEEGTTTTGLEVETTTGAFEVEGTTTAGLEVETTTGAFEVEGTTTAGLEEEVMMGAGALEEDGTGAFEDDGIGAAADELGLMTMAELEDETAGLEEETGAGAGVEPEDLRLSASEPHEQMGIQTSDLPWEVRLDSLDEEVVVDTVHGGDTERVARVEASSLVSLSFRSDHGR
jgi:hypothetical protein